MPLTIEDGTDVNGADSFITIAEFSSMLTDYFAVQPEGTDPEKEAALRRSWVLMSGLEWNPSLWKTFGGSIPFNVKLAQAVLGRAEVLSPLALSPQVTLSGRKVLTEVKGIKWTLTGGKDSVEESRPVVTMAMDLLRPYLLEDPAKDKNDHNFSFMSIGP